MLSRGLVHRSSVAFLLLSIVLRFEVWAETRVSTQEYAWLDDDILAVQCLNFSPREKAKFRQGSSLIQLRPVALPQNEWLLRNSRGEALDHFGWPVGIQVDEAIFVFYIRIPAHGNFEEFHKAAVVVSRDGGETFRPLLGLQKSALDLLDPDWNEYRPRSPRTHLGTWGNAAAFVDGRLIVTNFRGVYRSEDKGQSWKLLKSAGLPAQIPTNANWGQCPKLLVHPGRGIVSIGARPDKKLLFRSSLDYGETWREEVVHTGEPLQEPAGAVVFGKLVLMPRHDKERWTQFWSADDWLPLESARTNITPGERDTTDVAYNPVSKRVEAVVTNRIGGGPGNERDNCMTINLWSIAPSDLTQGKGDWRFDGTLVRSEGREHDTNNALGLERDGMHPGGTFIDVEAGYQYIYIYLGFFQGPSGVFQVRRTLETEKLREYLLD